MPNCKGFACLVLTWTALYLAGEARAEQPETPILAATPAEAWNAKFETKQGWIGGDCVYSVDLGHRQILWLFGDSLVGKVKNGGRSDCVFINNSIAIQNGTAADSPLRFVTGPTKQGKPTSFVLPADGKGWFWPQAGAMVGDRLLLFLPQIAKNGSDGGAFGFRQISQWLAIVDNPHDEPEKWRIAQRKFPFADFAGKSERSFGSALLLQGSNLYVYGYIQNERGTGNRDLIVARVPAEKVDEFDHWEFRGKSGWSHDPADCMPLAAGLATEFSVSASANPPGYLLVYTQGGLSDRILSRFAPAPDGPWSKPTHLYQCPEMAQDKGVFTYAAKAHPWATIGHRWLISYCVNAWDFSRLFKDQAVYRPKFVEVELIAAFRAVGPAEGSRPQQGRGRE